MAKYSQVAMLLRALASDVRVTVVLKLELECSDPFTFKYRKLRKHVLDICTTTNALHRRESEGTCTAPTFSPYSIPPRVRLPPMPAGVNFSAIVCEATLVPV